MNKRASALILGLFVILVLAGLSAAFLYKQINQSFLVNRYADSTRAFWIAEAGIQAINSANLDENSWINSSLGQGAYACAIGPISGNETAVINSTFTSVVSYYPVQSTGTFNQAKRTINAVVKQQVDSNKMPASNFKFGVESSANIIFGGSSTVSGETSLSPLPPGTRDPNYYKAGSVFSFFDIFGYSSAVLKAMCVAGEQNMGFYNNSWPAGNITGVTWVTAPSSNFNGNAYGSGVLIVEGDLKITGTVDFDGIVYVIGKLFMAGTAAINGSILAESGAEVTKVTGTADIIHNSTKIENALEYLKQETYGVPKVVSWQEN